MTKLSTRIVMTASSVLLFIAGIACLFAPTETVSALSLDVAHPVIGQILGALYLGFAAANWTARGSMIGGIFARPLSVANFVHFVVGGTVMAKGMSEATLNATYIVVALCYFVFAVLFMLVLYGRLEAALKDAHELDR